MHDTNVTPEALPTL